MSANTIITDSFFSRYGLDDSLTALVTAPLGDYTDSYDLDRLTTLHLEAINAAMAPLGVHVTRHGVAYCAPGGRPDDEDIRAALADVYDDTETVNGWLAAAEKC